MKVAMITDSLSRKGGGVFESVLRHSLELQSAGHEVCVFGLHDKYSAEDAARWAPAATVAVPRRGPEFFGWGPGLDGARQVGSPLVLSPHGMLDPWAVRNAGWKKRMAWMAYERRTFATAACLHALNTPELSAIRAFGIVRPVCVVPNGVDLPVLGGATTDANPALPGRKVLLYLGRIHPKKGLPALLGAWARVLADPLARVAADSWTLVIAGWGTGGHGADLRALALKLQLGESVKFVGPQFGADKDRWYRRCDAVVLPSLSEGLPMGVLEAWSYSKPVLMTPQCNLPEGAQAGAAVEAQPTVDGLAAAIIALVASDSIQREEMGQKGRRLVRDRFSWAICSRQMLEMYEWLIHRGSPPTNMHVT
jgi:poly(glycerol-phosphate) alpha-glucosyltransferase